MLLFTADTPAFAVRTAPLTVNPFALVIEPVPVVYILPPVNILPIFELISPLIVDIPPDVVAIYPDPTMRMLPLFVNILPIPVAEMSQFNADIPLVAVNCDELIAAPEIVPPCSNIFVVPNPLISVLYKVIPVLFI